MTFAEGTIRDFEGIGKAGIGDIDVYTCAHVSTIYETRYHNLLFVFIAYKLYILMILKVLLQVL